MANPNPKTRKAKHDIAPKIRDAFWNGLVETAERRGQTLSETMADFIEKDPTGMFNACSRYLPKE